MRRLHIKLSREEHSTTLHIRSQRHNIAPCPLPVSHTPRFKFLASDKIGKGPLDLFFSCFLFRLSGNWNVEVSVLYPCFRTCGLGLHMIYHRSPLAANSLKTVPPPLHSLTRAGQIPNMTKATRCTVRPAAAHALRSTTPAAHAHASRMERGQKQRQRKGMNNKRQRNTNRAEREHLQRQT